MKIIALFFFTILFFQSAFSQDSLQMQYKYGFEDKEVNSLLLFQNIDIETITFTGKNLIGKFYEVAVKEYKKGKLIKRSVLMDTEVSDYLKNEDSTTTLKFFTKIDKGEITVFGSSPKFYSAKKVYKIKKSQFENFLQKRLESSEDFVNVPINVEFPLFAIFTPYLKEDGTGAYCEVTQSNIQTEQYWKEFKIPHYFIITMKFK